MSFTLNAITPANKSWQPQKILVYGVQGLGKSKFGSTFENPIFIRTEDGAAALDVPTFPELVTTFAQMEEAILSIGWNRLFTPNRFSLCHTAIRAGRSKI